MPQVFVSYSWDDDEHREWVRHLATRLRTDGIDVILDRWHAVPGDQLPRFMENAVRTSDFVLAICTEKYGKTSDERTGGVGYEGDVMTAEALTLGNRRKFIPVLRGASWTQCAPSWLRGTYYVDLRGTPYSEISYRELLDVLHARRDTAPPIGSQTSVPSSSSASEDSRNDIGSLGHPERENVIERWLERWSQVTLHPTRAFASIERHETRRAVEFFFLNHLASYLAIFLACIFYFAVFYRDNLATSIQRASSRDIGTLGLVGAAYLLAHLFAAALGAAASFPVYHWMGSAKRLREHARVFFGLSTLEPFAAIAAASLILFYSDKTQDAGPVVIWSAGALFFSIRIYYSVIGFWGLRATHCLAPLRAAVAYVLGFVPVFSALSAVLVGLQWLVVVAFVTTWD